MKKLLDNFPKGTMLYSVEISLPDFPTLNKSEIGDRVEVLVSSRIVYMINKTNTNLNVSLNGITYALSPYAVEVFNLGTNP
jgi:hypothetical protein